MNLQSFVKVGNISNLSDARYCAGYGVNMLGFNLDPEQSDAISLETAQEIMGWVAVDHFVLECGHLSLDQIQSIDTGEAYLQIDVQATANELVHSGKKVILRYLIESTDDLKNMSAQLTASQTTYDYVLVESENQTLTTEIQQTLQSIGQSTQWLKGFDNQQDNVLTSASETLFAGIALKGSAEEKPGFKDYDELADVLEVLEIEE